MYAETRFIRLDLKAQHYFFLPVLIAVKHVKSTLQTIFSNVVWGSVLGHKPSLNERFCITKIKRECTPMSHPVVKEANRNNDLHMV